MLSQPSCLHVILCFKTRHFQSYMMSLLPKIVNPRYFVTYDGKANASALFNSLCIHLLGFFKVSQKRTAWLCRLARGGWFRLNSVIYGQVEIQYTLFGAIFASTCTSSDLTWSSSLAKQSELYYRAARAVRLCRHCKLRGLSGQSLSHIFCFSPFLFLNCCSSLFL